MMPSWRVVLSLALMTSIIAEIGRFFSAYRALQRASLWYTGLVHWQLPEGARNPGIQPLCLGVAHSPTPSANYPIVITVFYLLSAYLPNTSVFSGP